LKVPYLIYFVASLTLSLRSVVFNPYLKEAYLIQIFSL
jgi:hypothetical protein